MAQWTKFNKPPRRAYLKPLTGKPRHTGIHQQATSELYNNHTNAYNPNHAMAFNTNAVEFAQAFCREFQAVQVKMEQRVNLLFNKLNNHIHIKEKLFNVTLQQSKQFKLVLFWVSGQDTYYFIRYSGTRSLVSVSKPYTGRETAMSAYDSNDIYWLDFIPIPA